MDAETHGQGETLLLEMTGICKTYPENNVHANQDVHFRVREGEIHALVGENGAGKTSLMKILCGLEHPDRGTIKLRGVPVRFHSTRDAERHGIGMVHQQFSLIDDYSIADNIVLNREPVRSLFLYDRAQARRQVEDLSKRYGFAMDPAAMVGSLTVAEKQRVEILRVLFRGSTLLVLDEPTSLLTEQEVRVFFAILRQLREQNHTIIIITHKLDEVGQIADRVTVMRAGRVVASCCETPGVDKASLARMMVGKEVILQVARPPRAPGAPVLQVRNVCLRDPARPQPLLNDVSFEVREGQVLGIAAVAGNGLGELEDALTGHVRRRHPRRRGAPQREEHPLPIDGVPAGDRGRLRPGRPLESRIQPPAAARRQPHRRRPPAVSEERLLPGRADRDVRARPHRAVRHPRGGEERGRDPVGREHPARGALAGAVPARPACWWCASPRGGWTS